MDDLAPAPSSKPQSLYDKLWDSHVIASSKRGQALLYVDRHLVQEVSSPQAFERLARQNLPVRQPLNCIVVADHAVSTKHRSPVIADIADPLARAQVARLEQNAKKFNLPYIPLADPRQGIVHIIGPELGFTLPGTIVVCGDSHTSTHGAFGALAFGIGTSECATVLATQCLWQRRAKTMHLKLRGKLHPDTSAKDLALALIAALGANGACGYGIEYSGPAISRMSMAERMTLCNMTIEMGARVGLIAPDQVTFSYLADCPMAPKGADWDQALAYWKTLITDPGAAFDRTVEFDCEQVAPFVSWGTSPEDSSSVTGNVPLLDSVTDAELTQRLARTLRYMGLTSGMRISDIPIDKVFIGSCTNGRLEDLRAAATIVRGHKVAPNVSAIVAPGSTTVKHQAEAEGLDKIFIEAGFEWRHAGCSMCVAMNDDRLEPGERCASTSNRNFEGRQGQGGRTHLMSPKMAAAAALFGHIVDVRNLTDAVS